jgi:hypothetical protein
MVHLLRLTLALGLGLALSACGRQDLTEPPVPLGDFALGLNIAVADKVEMVPISRPATVEEWEAVMIKAVDDRFGQTRYQGSKLYNIGIVIEGYALAPPGIPVVAAPKSILVVTANIWDDAAEKKLNAEGKQFTVFESLSGDTVIGTGLTRNKKQQMEALAYNAVKKVEDWLLEHPEWFDMTPDQLEAAMAARAEAMAAAKAAPVGAVVEPAVDPGIAETPLPADPAG